MLPKIDMGDLLVIHDTGAHGFSMGYNYNGKLRSAELLLKEDGSVELIRRAKAEGWDKPRLLRAAAQIQGVWLAPHLRGRRRAGPAMAAVVEAVLAEHAARASLYVNDFNVAARATYARIGMREVGEFATVLL